MADELGLDPGLQLQQLEQQILVHDPALGVPYSTVRGLGPEKPVGNLPAMSAELVGRDTEVAAVVDLVADARLVEIVGPGGVGKTALAIAAGRVLSSSDGVAPGGVWLARLETAATADEVVDTLVAALNVGGEAALFERLKSSAAVVILDNCEHVIDAAAGARRSPARRRSRAADPVHQPGRHSTSTVRSCSSSHRSPSPTRSRCSRGERARSAPIARRARRTTPSRSCADRSMVCRWRSSSPRREPRRCRSRRSPGASTIGSAC